MVKKAILFDIDGTLLDALEFVTGALKHAFTQSKSPVPSDEVIKSMMGTSLTNFYTTLLPDIDPKIPANFHKEFQEKNFHLIKLFPKVGETLLSLKKQEFLVGAVSNRSRNSLLHSLKLTKILDYFNVVVSADDVKNPKPDKEHVLAALKHLEVEPDFAYMVGDTEQDIVAGKAAKVKTIGVTYGFLGKDIKKHKPDFLIDELSELLKILK